LKTYLKQSVLIGFAQSISIIPEFRSAATILWDVSRVLRPPLQLSSKAANHACSNWSRFNQIRYASYPSNEWMTMLVGFIGSFAAH